MLFTKLYTNQFSNYKNYSPRTRDCKGGEAVVCEANNAAERRNPGKPGFCSRQDAKMAPATKHYSFINHSAISQTAIPSY